MSLQAVHSQGRSIVYVPLASIDEVLFTAGQNGLIRFRKDNCKVNLYECSTYTCDDKLAIEVVIGNCINEYGRWSIEFLNEQKELLYNFDVIVYPHKKY